MLLLLCDFLKMTHLNIPHELKSHLRGEHQQRTDLHGFLEQNIIHGHQTGPTASATDPPVRTQPSTDPGHFTVRTLTHRSRRWPSPTRRLSSWEILRRSCWRCSFAEKTQATRWEPDKQETPTVRSRLQVLVSPAGGRSPGLSAWRLPSKRSWEAGFGCGNWRCWNRRVSCGCVELFKINRKWAAWTLTQRFNTLCPGCWGRGRGWPSSPHGSERPSAATPCSAPRGGFC